MIEVDFETTFSPGRAPRSLARNGNGSGGKSASRASVQSPVRVAARFSSEARILALFGRSGSGKSTVINVVAGLLRADRGVVRVDGETLLDTARGVAVPIERRGVGYVFQDGLLFPHMTVRQNLMYGASRGGPMHAPPSGASSASGVPFAQVVSLLGLERLLEQRAPTLSGGEKQRVAIGRALLSRPRLLLMDEPLASLDSGRRGEILRLIERVRDEFAVRIVYVSHSIGEVSRLADDVVLMNDGAAIACGRTEDIFNRSELRPYTGRFEGGVLLEAIAVRQDMANFMTTYAFDDGELVAPGVDTPLGSRVRMRIRARDVALATTRPQGLSIRNVLPGVVRAIDDRGGAIVEVHVGLILDEGSANAAGGQTPSRELLSRITRQAMIEMGLTVGQPVFALIKAIAFDKRSMGFTA